MNRRLVRFDIRVHEDDYVHTFWTAELRNEFLLNPAVAWPLSIDVWMWPSVFFSKIFQDGTRTSYATIEVDPSTDGGDYWLNLEEMLAYYDAHKPPASRAVPVAIELYSEKSLNEDMVSYVDSSGIECALRLNATFPRTVPHGSELLGFDIADAASISGLTNCGYTDEDQRALRPAWASRLNAFGLLKSLDDAIAYRQICDTRVAEHAPFWIYALWRVAPE
jgi:hypothetical protein